MLILAGALLLCAHLLLNAFFPHAALDISYVFFFVISFATASACAWRAAHIAPGIRLNWILTASSVAIWSVADVIEAYNEHFNQLPPSVATPDSFFYFFAGIPILLAISAPEERQFSRLFFGLDILQAIAAGYLAYIAIFSVLPFSMQPFRPLSTNLLVWIFDIEHFGLGILTAGRIFMSVRHSYERRFSFILFVYLWTYSIGTLWYNHTVGLTNSASTFDFVLDIPFIALTLGAIFFASPALSRQPVFAEPHIQFSTFVDNTRPIALGLVLVALSAIIAGQHLDIALGFIFGSFLLYGARSALLQSRFRQSQIQLEQARDRLEEMAMKDGLTGIANRRSFDQRLAFEWGRARRNGLTLSLLLIDIDHFKQINDTYGHITGDEYLKEIATSLRSVLHRTPDLFARYGGEEFAALLPETDAAGARDVAAYMCAAISGKLPGAEKGSHVTISIGLTTWDPREEASSEDIVETADKALYLAKQNGRNRVEFLEIQSLAAQ